MDGQISLLIVDDDAVDRMMISRLLINAGMELNIAEAACLQEAFIAIEKQGFDCILLDYLLPDGTGLDLLRYNRKHSLDTPVILLTGQGDERVAVEAMKAGALDYLVKDSLAMEQVVQPVLASVQMYRMQCEARATQKQLEQQEACLRQQQEKYLQLLDSARDMILFIGASGMITEANKAAIEEYGYSRAELLGLNVSELRAVIPDCTFEEQFAKGIKFTIFETVHRRKDGSQFPVEINSNLSSDGDCIVSIIRNVSERKQAEKEMLANREAAAQGEKLAALGTMAAAIAHEINQPLNAIKVAVGGTLFWQKRGRLPDIQKTTEMLTKIEGQCNRIENIIASIRAYVRQERGRAAGSCRIPIAIASALEILDNYICSAGINVSVELPEYLPEVPVDQQRFEEIIVNLIVNSIHALEDTSGRVKQVIINAECSDKLVLRFIDNGPGITDELKEKIFQPFFSTKASGKGMGLGLPIVKSTIEACGGEIFFNNNAEGGAVFSISFPLLESVRR